MLDSLPVIENSILDQIPMLVVVVRADGDLDDDRSFVLETTNSTTSEAWGFTREEMAGRPMIDLFPNVRRDGFIDRYRMVLRTQEPCLHEMDYGDENYERAVFRTRFHPLDERRVLVVAEDVTQELRAREQSVANQRLEAAAQIARGVAHDLNNMLAAILMTSRALRSDLGVDSPIVEDVEAIQAMTHRAADLVARLLDFSQQRRVTPEVVSVRDAVAAVAPMLTRLVGGDVRFELDCCPTDSIRVDIKALEQVLVNLATNARFAMPHGGVLRIESRSIRRPEVRGAVLAGPFVEIGISDTGVGMDPVTLEHCFDPFFTTRGRGTGSGMGLAMVDGVVRQAGGQVLAKSKPGQGTTILMLFPAQTPAPLSEPTPQTRRQTACHVLLVDDEDMLRRATARMLRRRGYTVTEAESGESALEKFKLEPSVDVLVTDVLMPGMNGPTLVDAIRAERRDLPVIFVSGYSSHAGVRNDVWEGARYLPKPFTQDELEATIAEALANSP